MTYYGYVDDGTRPVGGGSHNIENEGAESSNFRFDKDGECLGYVHINVTPPAFNLWRIVGPGIGDATKADGVLIVSVARDPVKGGQVVVGWHANATCHGFYSEDPRAHLFTARLESSVLLPPEERVVPVPRGKGGMGQFNVCYTRNGDGSAKVAEWIEEVLEYVEGYTGPNLLEGGVQPAEAEETPPATLKDSFDGRGFPVSLVATDHPEAPRSTPARGASEWFRDHVSFSLLRLDEIGEALNAKPQRIHLPSFQRDAAWDWNDIELLWDSVLRGYPMGSLLFAQAGQQVPVRPLRKHREAAATSTNNTPESGALILIDGQQRTSAIAIGLRRWSPGGETRLWLDLSLPKGNRYGFRLCSLTLPWGPKVSSAQKTRALQRLGYPLLPTGSEALGLTWPANAKVPVPFAELLALVKQDRFSDWRDLVPLPLRDQVGIVTPEQETKWRIVLEGISDYRVPAIQMPELPTVEDLGETFRRLNTAGVDMGQEELFFSGIKLRWPEAHDLVWEVYNDRETGRFLAPTKIVHLAVRLAATREPGSDRDILPMDLKAFHNHLESEEGGELLKGIASYLDSATAGGVGRLREVLREARKALSYHPEWDQDDPGFPAPLLADLSPHVWHILAAWIDRHHDVDKKNRAEMLRFAAALHFFFARPLENVWARRLFLESRNAGGSFPGQKLWKSLTEDTDRTLWHDIHTPKRFGNALTNEAGDQRANVLVHEHDLVVWVQRCYVQRWFPDYDPTLYTGRSAEKPYDMDHIMPKAHFDQRSSRRIKQAGRFEAVRAGALHSSGNFRLWPRSENRRDQDSPLAEKCLLGSAEGAVPQDSYLRREPFRLTTYGDVRRASSIPEEDVRYWREASSPDGVDRHDWSSAERLEAFDRTVRRRRVKMYQMMYDALGLGAWVER
jgi:hypothetical protein